MSRLADRIQIRLREVGLSPRAASLQAGLSPDGIRNILNGRSRSPRVETLQRIAGVLGVDLEWLTGNKIPVDPAHDMLSASGPMREAVLAPVTAQSLGRDLPILGAARGGDEASFLTNGELFEMTERPASLAGIKDAYAVYMVGESMEPRYHNGEVLFVHPYRPPERGKYVVVQLLSEARPGAEDEMEYLVKQYMGKTSRELILYQYNPQKELRFPLSRVRAVHRVVGTKDD